MRIPSRRLAAAIAVATTMTSTLISAPSAFAHAPDTGGIQILKKDTGGDPIGGVSFTLLDSTGKEAASGKTDADGKLVFKSLEVGVYRLKETSSGSPLLDVVPDQDVILTAGAGTPVTVIDPFKPAEVTVKKTDKSTGKPLAGAVINIAPTTGGTPVTLTTGKDGTAKATLPVSSRAGTNYTAAEVKAPQGYQLDAAPQKFAAKPGVRVNVALTDTKKEQAPSPKPTPPTAKPTPPTPDTSTPPTPAPHTPTTPSPSASTSVSLPPVPHDVPSPPAPTSEGALAHTGADATPWLLGGAVALLVAGGGAIALARRRRTAKHGDNGSVES
ncbi:SpaA isopeptide-forming pilin-related protein [Streptomyces sp. NPDC002221]|uniref:SpaA isopeptide-forming pilin-related protein n=1 Tax=Streptomyces sp. NPDC002221 TaxID=3364639 RepID=UPI0036791EB7